ncbi:hypothetical protein [Cellulomonas hominis]
MIRRQQGRPSRALVSVALAGLASVVGASAALTALAVPAAAAARVTVANEFGRAEADTTYSTPLTVSGTGFQSIQNGFGGIYVFFGWVDDPAGGSWAPSRGGVTGADYRYVPDSESKDNQGFQRFVTFPGSETAYAANGGEVAADGTWSLTMTVPGPTFQAVDRDGAAVTVNCLEVTCGIITIGAHGVKNAANESFTPVAFADIYREAPAGGTAGGSTGAAGAATGADDSTEVPTDAAAPAAPASVGIDQSTAVVGRVLGFTGQGFTPGEQVVGSLGGGFAAVGPLSAGAQGEVAGVLQLPADLRPGTHAFTLTGAASGQVAEVELQVIADPVLAAAAAAAANAASATQTQTSPALVAVGVAGLVLLATIISSFVTAHRRRRARRAGAAGPPASAVPGAPAPAPASGPPRPGATRPPVDRGVGDDAVTQTMPAVPAVPAEATR